MTGLEKYGEWLSSTEHPPETGGHELKVTLVIMMGWSPPAMFRCTGKRGRGHLAKQSKKRS